MSNNTLKGIPRGLPPAKAVRARIVIELLANGQVQVGGPLADKVTCLGLLELGKASILNYKPAEPAIEVAGQELQEYLKQQAADKVS